LVLIFKKLDAVFILGLVAEKCLDISTCTKGLASCPLDPEGLVGIEILKL
jgi:hypothetical protein